MRVFFQFLSFAVITALLNCPIFSQSDSLLVQNSEPVDADRYRGIDGSPYFFKEWVTGSVLRSDGKTVDDVRLNYNGHAHEIEVQARGNVYVLEKRWHLRVDVLRSENPAVAEEIPVEQLIFLRGVHRDLADRYATILFIGDQLTLIKDFDVGQVDKEFNTVSEKIQVQRFKTQTEYYLKKGGSLVKLRLVKKKILEAFGDDARVAEFMAKQKLNLSNEADLVSLVAYADTLQ